jgi:hypothetical protein
MSVVQLFAAEGAGIHCTQAMSASVAKQQPLLWHHTEANQWHNPRMERNKVLHLLSY